MAAFLDIVPKRDELIDALSGYVARPWLKWLTTLRDALNAAPQREVPTVEVSAETATVSATDFPAPPLKAGYYRITTFVRVTSGSGTVTPAITFTDDGSELTLTLDAVADVGSETRMVRVDAASSISYTLTVSGSPTYDAALSLERVEV